MSIEAELDRLTKEGTLLFLPPAVASKSVVRDVFVSIEVAALVADEAVVPAEFEKVAGKARAKLDYFSAGGMFVFGMNPEPGKKSPTCLMARNSPVELGIVDMRITDPRPNLRIFGGFLKADIFVALTWRPRDKLKFAAEVRRCRAQWDTLFPEILPVCSPLLSSYVSENVIPG